MYAIIRSGGKQYKVSKGERIRVESLPVDVDGEVSFDTVLAVGEGEDIQIGKPALESARVTGKVTAQGKERKVIVFHKKRRGGVRKKNGHRQLFTEVEIQEISAG
ncbi:MAG: 50S ribosomal protein L21 [Candidatus Sumerlaeota bacterium]